MNGVNLIYETDVTITHEILSINVRTSASDPYVSTDADLMLDEMLAEWRGNFVGVPRDIAHLMTGKNIDGGTIGLAYIGAICDNDGPFGYGYGLSQSKFSGNYQSRVSLTAHELGHNWSANHTASANIMCASIGGCTGIKTSFAGPAITSILNHKASRSCLTVVPDNLPNLITSKSVDQDPVVITENLQYTITVTNAGTASATGVVIVDDLPPGLTFVSSVPLTGVTLTNQTVNCDVGTLSAGASFTLLITASTSATGDVSNTASASANEADLVESNDEDEVTSEVIPALDINAASLSYVGSKGGPYSPACNPIVLSNQLSSSITWNLISAPSWLDVSSSGGSIAAASETTLNACVNTNADALTIGTYNDSIVFSNQTTGLQLTLPVTLSLAAVASMPFTEDFESGVLSNYWTAAGTADYRIQVTSANAPDSGSFHATLDDSVNGGDFSRCELTVTVNLANYTNVFLNYRAREYGDENHGLPSFPFVGGADFDGIAISEDGVTWVGIQNFSSLNSSYQSFQIDLDQAMTVNGLDYTGLFQIRFNQYDNYGISTDGIAIDNISITGDDMSNPDIDSDGLPNEWELQYYGNTTNAIAGNDDDGDGDSNINEYIADTNPTSDVSFLQFVIDANPDTGIALSYESSAARVYSVFCRTNAITGGWIQIQTNEPGVGATSLLLPTTLPHCGIYRLEVALP